MVNYSRKINMWIFLLIFLIGATSRYDLTLMARVPLSEVIAFLAIPFLLAGVNVKPLYKRLKPIVGIFLLWAFAIALSDVINGFVFERFIRAFARPVWCFLWMLFFIGVISRDFKALMLYPFGTMFAAFQNYFFPQDWTIDRIEAGGYHTVAYGLSPIVTSICLVLALYLYRINRLMAVAMFLVNAIVLTLAESPRNFVALALLNAAIIAYIWWTRREGGRIYQLTMKRVMVLGCLGFVACWGLYESYAYAAAEGLLGEMQRDKFIAQSRTIYGDSFIGLIIGGRTVVFGAILGIIDHPLWGTGSWTAWQMSNYYYSAVSMVGTSASDLQRFASAGMAPGVGHSIFFAGWLENGLLAALALLAIAYFVFKEFLAVIQNDSRLAPLLIYFGTVFFWAFFFSPFGVSHRLIIGLFLAFYILQFHKLKNVADRPDMILRETRLKR